MTTRNVILFCRPVLNAIRCLKTEGDFAILEQNAHETV
jgi:hypothetical protein